MARDNRLPVHTVGARSRFDIMLPARSPRKCRYPLFAFPLFEPARCTCSVFTGLAGSGPNELVRIPDSLP